MSNWNKEVREEHIQKLKVEKIKREDIQNQKTCYTNKKSEKILTNVPRMDKVEDNLTLH